MSKPKKKPVDIVSGEEFSDVSSSLDTDESEADTRDNWMFPVVSHKAKREEYQSVSQCAQPLLQTDQYLRLLKARKLRSVNFKITSKRFN